MGEVREGSSGVGCIERSFGGVLFCVFREVGVVGRKRFRVVFGVMGILRRFL